MIWLLKLYPPGFRRRYGRELADLMASYPFSIGTALDLVAGAIDAWIHPQVSAAVPAVEAGAGGATMLARMLELRCAGYGPEVTPADARKSIAVTFVGSAVVLVLLWWVRRLPDRSPYLESLLLVGFLVPFLAGLRYTTLKGRSLAAHLILILGALIVPTALLLLAVWIG